MQITTPLQTGAITLRGCTPQPCCLLCRTNHTEASAATSIFKIASLENTGIEPIPDKQLAERSCVKILVNASGAKYGGARTIVETYVAWIGDHDRSNEYIVIAGFENKCLVRSNIRWIKKATSGFYSFLYTTILIFFDMRRFAPDLIFSFNNVNYIFPYIPRLTYFHQLKLFEKKFDKTYFFRLAIKYFLKNTKFIVQSEHIKNLFHSEFGPLTNVCARWPGFIVPRPKATNILKEILKKHAGKKLLVCPYSSVESKHKNFNFILSRQNTLKEKNFVVLVTAPQPDSPETSVVDFAGMLPRDVLYALYMQADAMLFPSTHETLGLPIFEFAETGKPVLVYDRAYIRPYYEKFKRPRNIILFTDETFSSSLDKISTDYCVPPCKRYRQGEWENLFDVN